MEKLVNESKLIYFADLLNEEDNIVEMKIGKIYDVETYAEETGDTVCKFTSELGSITIDDDWINKEDYPDGFITKLVFKNGVIICEPQYDHNAVDICESEQIMEIEDNNIELQKKRVYDKIAPILKLYDEDRITKIEFVEKLIEAFYNLEEEDEIIVQKMSKTDDAIKLHKTLEDIFDR